MKKSSVCVPALGLLLALHAATVSAQPAAAPAPPASEPVPEPTVSATPEAPPPTTEAPPVLPPEALPPPPETPKPKPPPYSLPWQLRPVMAGNVVRSDTAIAFYEGPTTRGGTAVASMLLLSYKVLPDLAPLVRLGLVNNAPPTDKSARTGILNPVLGVTYGPKLHPNLKLGLFLGVTLPVGSGGGDEPHPQAVVANQVGPAARSMMDNAMFAVNYFAVFPGVGFAYVGSGFTAQVEATIFQLAKTRGPDAAAKSNTNFTTGAHVGYFLIPQLSIGTEIRHQRWLSTPANVKADTTGTLRDTTTWAIGPRASLKLSETMWLRPGVAYAMPLDNPMANGKGASHFKIVQIDIPFVF